MDRFSPPTYDPADVIIARVLKDWVRYPKIPELARSHLLANATQSVVKVSTLFLLRMVFKWVLLRGLELITFLVADESMVFVPSRDNYVFNPPHFKPCVVHSRVKDTFLLEAGMLGAI